jgi:predicted dehydrogenase
VAGVVQGTRGPPGDEIDAVPARTRFDQALGAESMSWPVTVAVLGTGSRGRTFAGYAERHPERVRVSAVADPRTERRDALADRHAVGDGRRFGDWRELVAHRARLADAVLVLTPDGEHDEAARECARRGYHVLLEKPIAPTAEACIRLVNDIEPTGIVLAVCHVLRYTKYTDAVLRVIHEGRIGGLVGVDLLEPVGWWHFAHSYVRGNWRRSDETGPSILTKCCHDLDWLRYVIDRPARRITSLGQLTHFTSGNRPEGAADRCVDCLIEPDCPYSAPRLYLGCLGDPQREKWPLGVVTSDLSKEGVYAALRSGPYGRCVYSCDNDVVDHQVTTIEFDGGIVATLTMSAFTPFARRRTRITGTHGFLEGDGENLSVTNFVTGSVEHISTDVSGGHGVSGGHDGGDDGVMSAFIHAVATGDRSMIRSSLRESLESHLMAFAAERSRIQGRPLEF